MGSRQLFCGSWWLFFPSKTVYKGANEYSSKIERGESVTTYFSQLNNCYVIIENVPCLKCMQCGEEFLVSSVSEKIDDILDSIEKIASKIFILDYSTAA